MKKRYCYPLVSCFLLFMIYLTGCGMNSETQDVITEEVIRDSSKEMLYAVNVDGVSNTIPFESVLLNRSKFWGGLVFQGLLVPKEEITHVQLDLCEEYGISPDGKTYTFILKEDVSWHDGRKLTVEDVLWTIETCLISNEVNGFMKKGLLEIAGADLYVNKKADSVSGIETEENTITIKLNRADETFLASLAQLPILPHHCFTESERVNIGESSFWKKPIGSGPYKVVSNEDNMEAVLVVNDEYTGKKPKISQIRLKVLDKHREEEFDFTITSDPDTIKYFKDKGGYKVLQTNNLYYRYLILNIDGRKTENKGLLNDKRVRQALVLGLDRKNINKRIYGSIALNIDSGIPMTDSWYSEDNLARTEYNPERAKELLLEAGFDFESTLVLTRYHEDALSVRLLETIAEYWRRLGIKIKIQPIDPNDTANLWGSTDWYDVGLKNLAAVDYSEWYFEYSSSNDLWSELLNNRTEFDASISAIAQARWSSERSQLYYEIQQLEREYVYKIPLAIIPQYIIYNKERVYIPDIQFPNMWFYYDLEISQWDLIESKYD